MPRKSRKVWHHDWAAKTILGIRVRVNRLNGTVVVRPITPPTREQKDAVTAWVIEQLREAGWRVTDELAERDRIWQ